MKSSNNRRRPRLVAWVTTLAVVVALAALPGVALAEEYPKAEKILETLLPLSVKSFVYRLMVEAAASEQIARRMAMKRATDSADDMIQSYTRMYNRSRQAGITTEITEIVSGASAME